MKLSYLEVDNCKGTKEVNFHFEADGKLLEAFTEPIPAGYGRLIDGRRESVTCEKSLSISCDGPVVVSMIWAENEAEIKGPPGWFGSLDSLNEEVNEQLRTGKSATIEAAILKTVSIGPMRGL